MLVWLSVWSEVHTCIWPSWCHCHSLSLALVNSRLVLSFWYSLAWVVPEKGHYTCACVCVCLSERYMRSWQRLCRMKGRICTSSDAARYHRTSATVSTTSEMSRRRKTWGRCGDRSAERIRSLPGLMYVEQTAHLGCLFLVYSESICNFF